MGMKNNIQIVIINQVSLNLGDAAILQGMIDVLKIKYGSACSIVVFDTAAEAAKYYRPWAEFQSSIFNGPSKSVLKKILQRTGYGHWFNRLRFYVCGLSLKLMNSGAPQAFMSPVLGKDLYDRLKQYRDADLIVSAGGTYLVENYSLEPRILEFKLALIADVPVVLFTQSMGPFTTPKNISEFQKIFDSVDLLLLRDQHSLENIQAIGCTSRNAHVVPDAAFALSAESQRNLDNRRSSLKRVGISVRSLEFFDEEKKELYRQSIASLVSKLVDEMSCEVTFISTCQGIEAYWTDDSIEAKVIVDMMPSHIKSAVVVDINHRQPQQFIDDIGAFDLMIATRMHAAILALTAGVVTVGIAYEFKLVELFEGLEMVNLYTDIDSMTGEKLVSLVNAAFEDYENIQHSIIRKVVDLRTEAFGVADLLPVISENNLQ
jgi:colanic acid/amylovoran biosynthesis protein